MKENTELKLLVTLTYSGAVHTPKKRFTWYTVKVFSRKTIYCT